jgi:hypothetical protein
MEAYEEVEVQLQSFALVSFMYQMHYQEENSRTKTLSNYTVRTFGDIFSAREIPVGPSTYQEHSTVIWTFNSLLTKNTNFLRSIKMKAQLSLCLIK